MSYTKTDLKIVLKNKQISSSELEILLKAREERKIDFVLMDIREIYEYRQSSIKGVDMLIPTSVIDRKINLFEKLKNRSVIIYCRTGSRTGQLMYVLNKMGYTNISHLSCGILGYLGETAENASMPSCCFDED